jgi:hypothetical protein
MKDFQATGEASCPQKKYPALQNIKFCHFFLSLWVIFALLDPHRHWECESGSGSSWSKSMRIRIHNTAGISVHIHKEVNISQTIRLRIHYDLFILSELVHLHKKIMLYLYKCKQFNFIFCVVWLMLEGRLILALCCQSNRCQSWSSFQLHRYSNRIGNK